jgi:hypothetical protein
MRTTQQEMLRNVPPVFLLQSNDAKCGFDILPPGEILFKREFYCRKKFSLGLKKRQYTQRVEVVGEINRQIRIMPFS